MIEFSQNCQNRSVGSAVYEKTPFRNVTFQVKRDFDFWICFWGPFLFFLDSTLSSPVEKMAFLTLFWLTLSFRLGILPPEFTQFLVSIQDLISSSDWTRQPDRFSEVRISSFWVKIMKNHFRELKIDPFSFRTQKCTSPERHFSGKNSISASWGPDLTSFDRESISWDQIFESFELWFVIVDFSCCFGQIL